MGLIKARPLARPFLPANSAEDLTAFGGNAAARILAIAAVRPAIRVSEPALETIIAPVPVVEAAPSLIVPAEVRAQPQDDGDQAVPAAADDRAPVDHDERAGTGEAAAPAEDERVVPDAASRPDDEEPREAPGGPGTVTTDLGAPSRVDPGNGASVTVMLGQSGVTGIDVDLAGAPATGDAQPDTVIANATAAANVIDVVGSGTSYSISGLSVPLAVTASEGALDSLVVNGLGGDDTLRATTLPAGVVGLTLDGGAGGDILLGSQGTDVLIGGDGDDQVTGDNGNDVAFLGAGDDRFSWSPGDGNDVVEGQGNVDLLDFNGSNASENISISANGGRVLFSRDVANVTMDLDDVEQIRFGALGGADNIVVGDMSGTDLALVEVRLGSSLGGGDGQPDRITVNATQGADVFGVATSGSNVSVFGLTVETLLVDAEAGDVLVLNGLGGDDVMDASALPAGRILLQMNGGLGEDVFLGSAGDDLFIGGDGDDTILMGAGNDLFVWNPGDDNDVIEGQAGTADRLLFNGANVAEDITISANGGRVLFFRNIANVTMDLNDTEVIEYNALGGADTITVNDLTGTDATTIRINLAASGGSGDGQVDTVIINATNGDDVIVLDNDANGITVLGLGAGIFITGFEATDRLIINSLGGDDTVDGSALDVTVAFQADGGDDDDVLLGGEAADILLGGAGDDVLIGGGGLDILDGGTGSNVVIQ